ncbi:TIGR04255 family protein [Thiotrichales bacterium HSG1]|nr:TIGR04255 family protein [Thiotrichales bacterium HSG1]
MNLPKRISPCPIIEAIFEIRFDSKLPEDAIFGIFYNKFQDKYQKVEQLPILQLPQVVRTQDMNLIYAPHYRLLNENMNIQIGPKIFSLANVGEYIGWDNFLEQIQETYEKVEETGVLSNINRISLRYINFFKNVNIIMDTSFKASIGDEILNNEKINFIAEISSGKSIQNLKIINSAEVVLSEKKIKGSIIDIDTAVNLTDFENFLSAINYAHDKEKMLFYKVLGEQFINTLNPEY